MNESSKNDLDIIFKEIVSTTLKLSSDIDQVVKEMFHPLLIQLVHWYSHSSQIDSSYTNLMITSLMVSLQNYLQFLLTFLLLILFFV